MLKSSLFVSSLFSYTRCVLSIIYTYAYLYRSLQLDQDCIRHRVKYVYYLLIIHSFTKQSQVAFSQNPPVGVILTGLLNLSIYFTGLLMSLRNKSTEYICCLLLFSKGPHPFAYLYCVSKLKTDYSFICSLNLLSLSSFKNVLWPRYIKPQGSLDPVSALGNPRASLEIPVIIIFFFLPLNFPRTVVQINNSSEASEPIFCALHQSCAFQGEQDISFKKVLENHLRKQISDLR